MIDDEMSRLLEPLEQFERIRRSVVRLGPRLADLSYANPYGGPAPGVREAIRDALDDERLLDLQYPRSVVVDRSGERLPPHTRRRPASLSPWTTWS